MTGSDRLVVALGGNALMRGSEGSPSVVDEANAAAEAFGQIAPILEATPHVLVTHGNGPQVGTLLLRAELSAREAGLPELPLDSLVADTAGGIGYLLTRELRNALAAIDSQRLVAAVLTQILVAPAADDPRKAIGPAYEPGNEPSDGHEYRAQPDGRRRRVVPSPRPLAVLEIEAIRALFDSGVIAVAGGGGGVPVTETDGRFAGAQVVVDKDLTSALLAQALDATVLMVLTNIDAARVDFGQSTEQIVESIDTAELRDLLEAGAFGEGSMAPKVRAAVAFASSGPGRRAVICHLRDARLGLAGQAGTQVCRTPPDTSDETCPNDIVGLI